MLDSVLKYNNIVKAVGVFCGILFIFFNFASFKQVRAYDAVYCDDDTDCEDQNPCDCGAATAWCEVSKRTCIFTCYDCACPDEDGDGEPDWLHWIPDPCEEGEFQTHRCEHDSTIYQIQLCEDPINPGGGGGGSTATMPPAPTATNTPTPIPGCTINSAVMSPATAT